MGYGAAELHSTSLGPGLPSWSHIKEQPCLSTCAGWSLFRFPLCWSDLSHFRCIHTYIKREGQMKEWYSAVWGRGEQGRWHEKKRRLFYPGRSGVWCDVCLCTVVGNLVRSLRSSACLWPIVLTFKCTRQVTLGKQWRRWWILLISWLSAQTLPCVCQPGRDHNNPLKPSTSSHP